MLAWVRKLSILKPSHENLKRSRGWLVSISPCRLQVVTPQNGNDEYYTRKVPRNPTIIMMPHDEKGQFTFIKMNFTIYLRVVAKTVLPTLKTKTPKQL